MAALLFCLSTARTAHATCGDYLMDHSDRQQDAGSFVSFKPAEFERAWFSEHDRRAPRRCHGPSCGQGSSNRVADAVPVQLNRSSAGGFACLTLSDFGWPPVLERLQIGSDTATLAVVELVKVPLPSGSLTTSTTLKLRMDEALAVDA